MIIKKLPDLSALNADTVDGFHAGNLLKRAGDSMTGKLGLSSNPETHDAITISNGSDSKGHLGITGVNDGILSVTTNIASVGDAKYIDVPSLPSWRSVLDTEIDSLYAGRAPAGTDTWADLFRIDNNGNISSTIGLFGYNSVTLTVASSTASESFKAQADYVCDGTADEVQINAAIAYLYNSGYPGTILLSDGIFYVSSAIGLCSNQVLRGAGMNCTIITKKNSAGAFSILSNTHQASGDSNMAVQNLTVDGNRPNNAGDAVCVLFVKVNRVLVDNVEIRQTANDGIQFNTTCGQCIMNNCYIHDIGVSGIVPIISGSYLIIRNCRVFNCVSNGMYINGQTYASITGNVVIGSNGIGISVPSNSTNISVTGNIVKNCATNGIQLDASYSTASGNIVTNCGTHTILSENSYNTVSGNIIAYGGANGYGICSYNAGAINGINAAGNLIYSCATDGIVFQNSNNSAVTGNNIIKSGMHGLYSGEASNHTLIAGNLLAESGTAADNTYYGMCINSSTTDNLLVGNKVYRGASGNRALYDLYVIAGTSNNTVLMNEFAPATGGATFPWLSGWTYRKSHTITGGKAAGWWVRWWTDSSHVTTVGDGTLVEDSNWNTVNVTNYRSSGTYINARAECTFIAPYAEAFTFYCSSDDGIRMYWDGNLVTFSQGDGWKDQGDTTYSWTSGTLALNSEHTIAVEHYQGGGGEHFHVEVQSASLTRRDLSGANCWSPHHSSTLSNFQMRFVVTATGADSGATFSCAGHSANSLWDVRFTNANGTPLSQWVESNNGSTAIIWVKMDSIPTTATTFYMFYGNAGAGDVSDTSIFEFFEHFPGTGLDSDWTSSGTGNNWATVSGSEYYSGGGYDGRNTYTNAQWGLNYACVMRCYVTSSGEAILGWWNTAGRKAGAHIQPYSTLTFSIMTNNGSDANAGTYGGDKNNWHVYETRRHGYSAGALSVECLYDGAVQGSVTNQVPTDNLNVILNTWNSNVGHTHCDWVFVRKSAPVEPAHGAWGSEATGTFYVNDSGTNTKFGFDNSASLNRTS